MTVKELINKLMDMPLYEEVGVSIRKNVAPDTVVFYVGAKGNLRLTSPRTISEKGVWIEAEIKDNMEILKSYGVSKDYLTKIDTKGKETK